MAISWDNVAVDPKRRFRFKLQFGTSANGIKEYFVKTATMPKANISTIEHSYFDYNFKYPGRVTWDPITVTLVAPSRGAEDPTDRLFLGLQKAGYLFPNNVATDTNLRKSLSKKGFSDAFGGDPTIALLDGNGEEVEVWKLNRAFLTSVDYGGSLDYTSDEMLELTMEITFDWASRELTK
tara:strand:- start:219 stop:758 length:540 start_codon:yes stop_codon:yes gene_type:complete